jgi:anti-anti-sigma factor
MSEIQIAEETRGDWHLVRLTGPVDSSTAETLARTLRQAVAAHERVALDISAVGFVSSAGLAALLDGARAARAASRQFSVCGPTPPVREVFDISRLNALLDVRAESPC